MTSAKQTLSLVNELKAANEDFEFYPTTSGMIDIVSSDIKNILETHSFSERYSDALRILDVGAGDGRVLLSLKEQLQPAISEHKEIELLAIEKSTIQINSYRSKAITLIGTEFNETNLISKNAEIAFVNPPYKHFEFWLSSIIARMNFGVLYAIVPKRWSENNLIKQAINDRQIVDVTVLASMDFHEADRAARAEVEIIRFSFNKFEEEHKTFLENFPESRYWGSPIVGKNKTDPFNQFIENELGVKKTESNTISAFKIELEIERIQKEMKDKSSHSFSVVQRQGVLAAALENYEKDLAHILAQYKKIGELDPSILQELGVDNESIMKGVREKLFGYRNVYWELLFEHLDVITGRLTGKHKTKLLNTLKSTALDFTHTNALHVINYAVDLANEVIEECITDVYKDLTSEASISRYYVSNQHMYRDDWRYSIMNNERENKAKYLLDYRFIYSSRYSNFKNGWLIEDATTFVKDLMVVFKLLGYSNIATDKSFNAVDVGDSIFVLGTEPNGNQVELVKIRFHKNGNRHISFNQSAMLRLNVAASRILGWVRNKGEFEQENELKKPISEDIWATADEMKILPTSVLALTKMAA